MLRSHAIIVPSFHCLNNPGGRLALKGLQPLTLAIQELTRLQARTEGRLAAALSHSKDAKHKLAAQDRQLVSVRRSNEKLTKERDVLEVTISCALHPLELVASSGSK